MLPLHPKPTTAWCAKRIAGCESCTREVVKAEASAQFPQGEAAGAQVVVRCLNCTAPLYVYNADNQNCGAWGS